VRVVISGDLPFLRIERYHMTENKGKTGWGIDNIPYPEGPAQVYTRDLQCVGCGICELACAFRHHGTLNRELSRIRIHKRMTPVSKSLQTVCAQCGPEERRCEKACPIDPPVIHFDYENQHMTVDADRCIGKACGRCAEACGGDAIHFYPPEHDYALVCDLCEEDGLRRPQCVEVCPRQALEYMPSRGYPFLMTTQHLWRISADEKVELIHKRTYPLEMDNLGVTDKPFSERREKKDD
jgi:Fe-S-cluster-containing hydrogenase component 2